MIHKHSLNVTVFTVVLMIVSMTHVMASDQCTTESDCSPYNGLTNKEISAYPVPLVDQIPVNEKLLYDRYYEQANSKLDIFDAPGGTQTATLDDGFNFVTVLKAQDGWTEINPDQWVHSDSLDNSNGIVSQFSGVLLDDAPMPYPVAWALVNFYPSREPGGNPDETYPIVWRYSHLNLYSSVEVDGSLWYQIGIDQWVHQFHVAKIAPIERPAEIDTHLWISIDLYEQTMVAYEGDKPVMSTLVSSGLSTWPTNEGLFHIYFRRERKNMSGGVPGEDFYFLEEVPWTMFFDDGRALHGAYWHDGFGYRRSHGCVNLSITDAHWLYQWVADEMDSMSSADKEDGPAVYIFSSGEYANS